MLQFRDKISKTIIEKAAPRMAEFLEKIVIDNEQGEAHGYECRSCGRVFAHADECFVKEARAILAEIKGED